MAYDLTLIILFYAQLAAQVFIFGFLAYSIKRRHSNEQAQNKAFYQQITAQESQLAQSQRSLLKDSSTITSSIVNTTGGNHNLPLPRRSLLEVPSLSLPSTDKSLCQELLPTNRTEDDVYYNKQRAVSNSNHNYASQGGQLMGASLLHQQSQSLGKSQRSGYVASQDFCSSVQNLSSSVNAGGSDLIV